MTSQRALNEHIHTQDLKKSSSNYTDDANEHDFTVYFILWILFTYRIYMFQLILMYNIEDNAICF